MLESEFNPILNAELKRRLPGCVILKQDAGMMQAIPDKLVLWEDKWGMLETKRGFRAKNRPNQPERVEQFNNMSFAAFINPDNMNEVLDDLQSAFGVEG